MRKLAIASSLLATVVFASGLSVAQTVVIEPGIDTWVMGQPEAGVVYEGDVVVGTALPDTVEIIGVPDYDGYGYVMLNKRRVLVDRRSRKVVKIYE